MNAQPPFHERLADPRPLLADGAMGTQLYEHGLKPGECPEAVTLSRPELLTEIAAQYLDAGAEILQTNTFGASPMRLAQYGLESQVEALCHRAVEAARAAISSRRIADRPVYVCGSCGPCGIALPPHGNADRDEVFRSFRTQLSALVQAGVDGVCIETMSDLGEATLAIRAAREVAPEIPILATMTFSPTVRGYHTLCGVSVRAAAVGLLTAGATVVGANCGTGFQDMLRITLEFREATEAPIVIRPNAGIPTRQDDRLVYPETPAMLAKYADTLIHLGVKMIGGCCGTTPAHIRVLRERIDALTTAT